MPGATLKDMIDKVEDTVRDNTEENIVVFEAGKDNEAVRRNSYGSHWEGWG